MIHNLLFLEIHRYAYISGYLVTFFFNLKGPNHTHSADGHDKLMDFIRDTFPLAVYGLQDMFSGRLLFVKIWRSNSDPKLTGRWYLEHLYETKGTQLFIMFILPSNILKLHTFLQRT